MGDILENRLITGSTSYKARIRRKGQPLLTKTFIRKTDAKKWIQQEEAKILDGRGLSKPKKFTIEKAIDRYILEVLPQKKLSTRKVQGPMLKKLRDYFEGTNLNQVDYDCLMKARQWLQDDEILRKGHKQPQKRGNAAINRYFALLRHIYSVAIRDWRWADENPVTRLRPLRESSGRNRFLTDEEMSKISSALDKHPRKDFRLIVMLALVTGCRRGNIQSIQWEDIDFKAHTITFPDTKNNRPHVASIPQDMLEELLEYRKQRKAFQGYVFASATGSEIPFVDVKQVWRRFSAQLGFKDLRFHDLRHAVASYLAKQNVSLFSIGQILGHRSLESTKRYAHIGVEDMVPHAEQLSARLRRVK